MFTLGIFCNRYFDKRYFPKGYLSKEGAIAPILTFTGTAIAGVAHALTAITPNLTYGGTAFAGAAHTLNPKTSDTVLRLIHMEQE